MNIKEKLLSLGIDVDNDKDSVNKAKKALKDNGFKADRIVAKITSEGEKILDNLFSNLVGKEMKVKVAPPATIKKTDDIPEKQKKSNKNVKPVTQVAHKEESEKINSIDEKVPFWKNNKQINIKTKLVNKNFTKNDSPNGRPLPPDTVKELKNKSNNEQNTTNTNTQNNRQKNNLNEKRDSLKKNQSFNNGNANNNLRNSNDKKQNKGKIIPPYKENKHAKVSLNTGNANIVTGTNTKFEGRKRDKAKYNKDTENKKKSNSTALKSKDDKHKNNFLNEQDQYRTRKKPKNTKGAFVKPTPVVEAPSDDIKSIILPEVISIRDLAHKLKIQSATIVKKLFLEGKMVNPNTELSYAEAENIALEYNILCEKEPKVDVIAEVLKDKIIDDEKDMVMRPPVVCVMGHVDHGKTSILDVIRKTNVIDKEAGGITQHIGAYQVKYNDRVITFLDTPGHEAFTAMRMRGAQSTDIAVLVVAADDGVMPQTIEAINHAKAANVEIVVAVNKIDKPEANVDKVKQELSEQGLIPEDWGGSTTFCEVSAKKNIGISNLIEMILLTSDVMELKANPNRMARGIVIEAELDKGKGPVARVIVQKGTLKIGDYVAMGKSYGKVRAMIDCNGNKLSAAGPSTPVEILGLNDTPMSGDIFIAFKNEKDAKNFAVTFISESKQKLVEDSKKNITLDALFDQIKSGEVKELPIIIKSDVVGSSEALKESLEKLSNDEVSVKVIHAGVGNINESDITLAITSHAVVIGFNTKIDSQSKSLIDDAKIDVRLYNVIYNAIEDVENAIKGMIAPVYEEKVIGHLTIRQVFKSSSVGNIAGCIVNDGEITRNSKVRLYRGGDLKFEGEISSLKRFKDEVKEVKTGFECGIVLSDYNDFLAEDTIEAYILVQKQI